MSKKKQDRIEDAEKKIVAWAKNLAKSKPGSLNFRVYLVNIEEWIFIRKGLLNLKDMGEL